MSTDKKPKEKKPTPRQILARIAGLHHQLSMASTTYALFSRQLEVAEKAKGEALARQVELLKQIAEEEKAYRIAAGVPPEAEKEAYGLAYGSACHG